MISVSDNDGIYSNLELGGGMMGGQGGGMMGGRGGGMMGGGSGGRGGLLGRRRNKE
jgi:hypothetical protein